MAKDPAFLFYPGDYFRDTQNLSEKAQVAYDRIMCEHMRNICITQAQLNFFIKRLSSEEKDELTHVLTKKNGCYFIEWVADSINKRKAYSTSRSNNKKGKKKESYDPHMENEDVSADEIKNTDANAERLLVPRMVEIFKKYSPKYPTDKSKDGTACLKIAKWLAEKENVKFELKEECYSKILPSWEKVSQYVAGDNFMNSYNISQVEKYIQSIIQKIQNGTGINGAKNTGINAQSLSEAHAKYFGQK